MRVIYKLLAHVFVCIFIALMLTPLYLAIVAASHDGQAMLQAPLPVWPGSLFVENFKTVLWDGLASLNNEPIWRMLWNSFCMAFIIASGKIFLALGAAFSLVYFDFPFKKMCFILIFATLMLPVEVRIVPTFQVVASLDLLNTFTGLTLPLFVSATGTFLFRQFFKTIPKELVEAAKLDGAGALRFFFDMLLPLSKTQISSLFVILFVYGWNQYLWPLLVTTESRKATIVMGVRALAGVADQIPQWQYIMSVALIALIPPCLFVLFMQRAFERGLQ